MRIEQLFYLVEVSKNNSITVTAERIHVSQQNISVAIRNLEHELGVVLLNRTHKGVSLTQKGEEFVRKAQDILVLFKELRSMFSNNSPEENEGLEGELRIEVVPYMTLPAIIVSFYKLNPGVDVILKENSPKKILENVVRGTTELGIIYKTKDQCDFFEEPNEMDLCSEDIILDKTYICVGKKSHLRHKTSITYSELLKQKIVVFEDLYDWIIDIIKRNYFDNKPDSLQIQKSSSIQIYKKLIEEDIAIGLATGLGLKNELIFNKGEVIAIPIKENNIITVCIVYSSKYTQTNIMKEFIKHLKLTTKDYHYE